VNVVRVQTTRTNVLMTKPLRKGPSTDVSDYALSDSAYESAYDSVHDLHTKGLGF
jgi:hypothetical protein